MAEVVKSVLVPYSAAEMYDLVDRVEKEARERHAVAVDRVASAG